MRVLRRRGCLVTPPRTSPQEVEGDKKGVELGETLLASGPSGDAAKKRVVELEGGDIADEVLMGDEDDDKHLEVPARKKRRILQAYKARVLPDWFKQKDSNGNEVSSYLRSVANDERKVYCTIDNTEIQVEFRGWAAVSDHLKSQKHLSAIQLANNTSSVGAYFMKNAASSERTRTALMKLLIFSTCHGLAFANIKHLVKTCQEAFPDSLISKDLSMGRTSAEYHLKYGLSKTETLKTFSDISSVPFSLSLDTGVKGRIKRTEVIVRYYSDEEGYGRVVERPLFIIISSYR